MRKPRPDSEPLTRRHLVLRGLGLAGGALALGGAGRAPAAAASSDADRALMARAVELRRIAVERGDQAFGAVVARDGQIVGEGISAVLTTPDPTAHGEVQAIRDAARRLGTPRLAGCELYTTFRPCPMCEAAAYWAGIGRIVHGEAMTDAGAPRLRC
ncbi:MAG TPA: nucleoside deaminase [Methylomirabilota bacterium]|nr:nucleoside deaminase [Methylomirabilota bacterium]